MDYFSGTDILFTHRFLDEGEPFAPDANTVTYTVFNHVGAPITGLVNVPVTTGPTDFQISFSIAAVNNSIGAGKNFERRIVVVTYQKLGIQHRDVHNFRIIPMGLFSVEPKDVRAFAGMQEKELPDQDIDLFAAYLYVKQDLGTVVAIDTALTSGTTDELAVNELIKLRAIISLLPSLKQRMAQEETNGVTGFKRINLKDFSSFEEQVLGRYAVALEVVLAQTAADFTLVLTTTDADPITGA